MNKQIIMTVVGRTPDNWVEEMMWKVNHNMSVTFDDPAYGSVVEVITSVTNAPCVVKREDNGLYRIDMRWVREGKRNRMISEILSALNKKNSVNCEVHFCYQ